MMQGRHGGTTDLEEPVNLIVIWLFLLVFCETTTFGGGGICSNYTENTRRHVIEFIRLGKQARGICVTMLYGITF